MHAAGTRATLWVRGDEKIASLKDRWAAERQRSARLGYEQRREAGQQLVGLLDAAGDGVWTELTVGRSMRETENEINLLVPGTGLFDPPVGAPEWAFTPRTDLEPDDSVDDDDLGTAPSQTEAVAQ